MNDSKVTVKLNRFLDRRTKLQNLQDEKDSKPEINPELTTTSKDYNISMSKGDLEKFKKAIVEYHKQKVFSNENGTVYKSVDDSAPEGTAALSIEGATYWSSLSDVQALQDFLSLRVRKAKEAEVKFKKTFTPIKKNRNKMAHLTPKKKKRK